MSFNHLKKSSMEARGRIIEALGGGGLLVRGKYWVLEEIGFSCSDSESGSESDLESELTYTWAAGGWIDYCLMVNISLWDSSTFKEVFNCIKSDSESTLLLIDFLCWGAASLFSIYLGLEDFIG